MDRPAGSLLVVDDDPLARDLLAGLFRDADFEVATAADGPRGLALALEGAFDLVLLDLSLPGRHGLDVLSAVRQARPPTELPVIMVTGWSESVTVVEALRRGANDYVTKPLDVEVVLARVQTQLALKRSAERSVRLERELAERNRSLEEANARLVAANRRLQRDLKWAARIQAACLPEPSFRHAGTRFEWLYRPCEALGGDGLNVFALDEGHVGAYVLDVSGHGVASALLAVALSRVLVPTPDPSSVLLRRSGGAWRPVRPAEVVGLLNRRFPFDPATGQFFTIVYGVLDVTTGEFTYVTAGHPGPIIVPADGPACTHQDSGFLVGLSDTPYEEQTLRLASGDRLYLLSDGVPEAQGAKSEPFGFDRLLDVLARARSGPLDASVSGLAKELGQWCNGAGFRDDVSVLAGEYRANGAAS
jgi:phosphoserine phosphatase RsbU/P